MSATVAIDLMAAIGALVWALAGARQLRGRLRATLGFLLGMLALLLVLRSLARIGWLAEGWAILVALVLPLAVLLCAETVHGVHAPRWAKAAVAGLPAGVLLNAIAGGDRAIIVWATAALVLATLVACAWWVRPRGSGRGTRGRVGLLFALAFALAVPLTATDFVPGEADVRLGGLAVLLGLALGARLTSTGGDARAALALLAVSGSLAVALTALLAITGALDAIAPSAVATVLAVLLLADVLVRSSGIAARAEELGFLRALADMRTGTPGEVLASLRDVPALRAARVLGTADLADHDLPALKAALSSTGVLRAGAIIDATVADEAAHLFTLHDADHALLVAREPFQIAMLRTGPEDVAATELRLRVVARLLALVDTRKDTT